MAPIQEEFKASTEWQKITDLAYPPEGKKVKDKKVKNKGTRHPGDAPPKPEGSEATDSKAQATLPDRTA
jgi:tyrosyl-tRNA synthetase